MTLATFPRAFGVLFKGSERWDVTFFHQVSWHWPRKYVLPLSRVLNRKQIEVSNTEDLTRLPIIAKISFGGIVSVTEVEERKGYKGRLFWAEAGDLIYSKIRVKQGSLAVVPLEIGRVAVSAEYPIYSLKAAVADSRYIELVLRTRPFLKLLDGLAHGGSTKTRIPPEDFERLEIPLPPLATQRAIVARWQQAQVEAMSTKERIDRLLARVDTELLVRLGVMPPKTDSRQHKYFAVHWRDLSRWDYEFAKNLGYDFRSQRYRNLTLADVVLPLGQTARRITPAAKPREIFNYIGMENVESITGRLVDFSPDEGSSIKSSCVVFDSEHILYGKLRPYLRKVISPIDYGLSQGVASSEFLALKPRDNVMKSFLVELLRSPLVALQAKQAIGARMPRIATEAFLAFTIPVPSLDQQKTIVEYIETLRAEIAREREAAARKFREAEAEIETMILGARQVAED